MNTIQTFFGNFVRETVHPSATAKQVEDCRVAFYAGAGSMLMMLNDISHLPNEEAQQAMIQSLDLEVRSFFLNYQPPQGL